MGNRIFALCLTLSLSGALACGWLTAQSPADMEKVSKEMADAAKKLLASCSQEQIDNATFDFKDNERGNWHFIPKPRKGLPLKHMSAEQRELAKAMLLSGMSQAGADRVYTIMSLEAVLKELEAGPPKTPARDPEMYFWSIFGNPTDGKPWGWRVEGHHMSVNFTVIDNKAVAAGPAFMGSNPAEVREGPKKGLRVLAQEEDLARALVKSLSEEQLKKTMINASAPKDIITGAQRQAVIDKFEGITHAALNDDQKAKLVELIALYAGRFRGEIAEQDMARIKQAGLDKVYFAWAGPTTPGEGHYYRIHGPTFLIEYDNTQNNANHIHSVWRDLQNDFGGDLLKKHYEQAHK